MKCHGSSNDFVLIDELKHQYHFSENERVQIARLLCDREGSIGADGILFTMPSHQAHARMRMFNPDGSEAEMCGNGLRCVGRYVCEQLDNTEIVIETKEANLSVKQMDDMFENIPSFEVAIEPVRLRPASLPLNIAKAQHVNQPLDPLSENLLFTAVAVPNPHLIAVVNRIEDEQLNLIGRQANENKFLLPNGVNVSFVQLLARNKIFVRTYERGVGLTNACGTAMSASSLTTVLLKENNLDEEITVFNRGGFVICTVTQSEGKYTIQLRGNATYEYDTTVSVDLQNGSVSEIATRTNYVNEQEAYEQMKKYAQSQII